eukprot:Opistho-2@10953
MASLMSAQSSDAREKLQPLNVARGTRAPCIHAPSKFPSSMRMPERSWVCKKYPDAHVRESALDAFVSAIESAFESRVWTTAGMNTSFAISSLCASDAMEMSPKNVRTAGTSRENARCTDAREASGAVQKARAARYSPMLLCQNANAPASSASFSTRRGICGKNSRLNSSVATPSAPKCAATSPTVEVQSPLLSMDNATFWTARMHASPLSLLPPLHSSCCRYASYTSEGGILPTADSTKVRIAASFVRHAMCNTHGLDSASLSPRERVRIAFSLDAAAAGDSFVLAQCLATNAVTSASENGCTCKTLPLLPNRSKGDMSWRERNSSLHDKSTRAFAQNGFFCKRPSTYVRMSTKVVSSW